MDNPLPANSSALDIADNCTGDCDISAENLAIAECVLRILDDGIQKLQISMIIPDLLDDQELLKQCLTKTEYQKCIQLYNDYMKHAELMQDTEPKQLHIALIELIDLFCENRCIRGILPEHVDKIDHEHEELIGSLIELRKIAQNRLMTTAILEMRREKAIHRIYQDNEFAIKAIAKQKKALHDKEISLRWKMAAKQALIKKYEEDLATRKWENNLKIKQEILKSSHMVKEFHAKSMLRQEHLAEELEKAQASYEKGLRADLKAEKEVRDEKNKLLIQLQGLIKKYDQTIGDKIQENAELQKAFDEQKRVLDEFLINVYNPREAEYNELAQKKLAEETAEFERKLWLFMATRAVKILQRAWRRYLRLTKKLKPKAEKGKKKKKK